MPTRDRAELLARALDSVVGATASVAEHVEVVVSDGSADEASARVVEHRLSGWPGGYRYVSNRPALSLPGNINRAMRLATGEWILQLHDDDYLLPEAGPVILETTRRTPPGERVLLFGVELVDVHGVVHRRQKFRRERYLEPRLALRRVLRNSSFVRQPAAVVRREAFEDEGWYDTTLGGPCDTDMWVRLFSRYGVRCVPTTTCAYTTHQGAATTTMWRPGTIRATCEIFDRAVARGVVPERSIRRWQADFFHQFILAGAYRSLRRRQRAEARDVLRLFDLPELRHLGASPKWLPVRAALTAATAGVRKQDESALQGDK
jgi:glycosyltransferase involved in cell wall biosynthesis